MNKFSEPKFCQGIVQLAEVYGGKAFWLENLNPRMNPIAIWRALMYVGCLKFTGVEDRIRRLLLNKDSRVRAWACFALGRLENEESVEQIRAMNADSSNRVRIHAWEAIKTIVGPEHSNRTFSIRIPRQENLILISEDSKIAQQNLSNLFRNAGYRVKIASTAQETITKAIKYQPQAIITDNQKGFDNLSGLTLTWDICRMWNLQETVLFMLTADFIEPVFLWNGGDYFLTKFEHPHGKLAEAVNEHLHH